MVGAQDQARSLALEKLANGLDLLRGRDLTSHRVVQPEYQEGIGIRQHPLIKRQLESGLVNPLKHGDDVPGEFADETLKGRPCPEEQLQTAGDPLLELHRIRPLGRLPSWPLDPPNLVHRRETIVQFVGMTIGLRGKAPAKVDTHPSPSRRIGPRDMILIVCTRKFCFVHFIPLSRYPGLMTRAILIATDRASRT